MKTLVLITLITAASIHTSCQAQYFAPVGSSWYYDQTTLGPFDITYVHFSVEKDTVIQGKNCRKIVEYNFPSDTTPHTRKIYTYYEQGKVYVHNYWDSTFNILYDFTLNAGDTMSIAHPVNVSKVRCLIDSISMEVFSGDTLRKFHLTQVMPYNNLVFGTILYEKLGGATFMFARHMYTDPPWGDRLRCYTDNVLGTIKFSTYDCNYVETGISEIEGSESIQIMPNPSNGLFHVRFDRIESEHSIEIFDFSGKKIQFESKRKLNEIHFKLNAPPGFYFVKFSSSNWSITRKLILH